jgi:aminomethyltransferase
MLKKTPLNRIHRESGARMVDFGGWDMPVQYSGVIDEHLATRTAAGLFDVSHMGEIEVRGPGALRYIQQLTTNDASRLVDGQVQYSAMCYPHGGVVDDVTLYRFHAEHYMFCVNASNIEKDFAWMQQVLKDHPVEGVTLTDLSDSYAQLALQGPHAAKILSQLTDEDLAKITFYHFREGLVAGLPTVISRTGYTGEDGFELYLKAVGVESLWTALMTAGENYGLVPCGLGARDTLRLEMKYALNGHELSAEITPLEAGLGWITKLDKPFFVGRDALVQQQRAGVKRRLAALVMTESGIPRADYPVFDGERQVGVVTSGTLSPCLKIGIALALVTPECSGVGKQLSIGIRSRQVAARVAKTPFIKNWRD